MDFVLGLGIGLFLGAVLGVGIIALIANAKEDEDAGK